MSNYDQTEARRCRARALDTVTNLGIRRSEALNREAICLIAAETEPQFVGDIDRDVMRAAQHHSDAADLLAVQQDLVRHFAPEHLTAYLPKPAIR